jgi:hypothetical protein
MLGERASWLLKGCINRWQVPAMRLSPREHAHLRKVLSPWIPSQAETAKCNTQPTSSFPLFTAKIGITAERRFDLSRFMVDYMSLE